jgi:predicted 3-demethylubiquinone-9 3-methyltransferase (glyoxalase superfamily)
MKRNISIQLKAALLLVVFGLNTVVGFACSMGVDVGFNTAHHHDEATKVSLHIHADGKKHQHHQEANKHQHDKKGTSKKDGCCNDKVISFQILDKNLNQNSKTAIDVPGFAAILSSFFGTTILKTVPAVPQKHIVPTSHPPPPDIRIAIRSFQI